MKKSELRVLELFSGIGGMHYALQEAQKVLTNFEFNVVRAIDISDVANQSQFCMPFLKLDLSLINMVSSSRLNKRHVKLTSKYFSSL